MRRVLVTGASGFIGRHTLEPLLARGFEVHGVSRSAPPSGPDAVTWHAADLLAAGVPGALVSRVRPTHLLHLAWYVETGKYWDAPVNVAWTRASLELVEAFYAHGGSRATLAGTCAEYDWQYGFCSERTTPIAPRGLYGVSKHAVHAVVDAYARSAGLDFAWGRMFFLYGPGEHAHRLVASVARALTRATVASCSSGTQRRDFLHVADAAEAFVALLDSTVGGPVNIGSGEAVRVRDVALTLERLAGGSGRVELGSRPAAADEPPLIVADVRRLTGEVGWRPRFDLESGLQDALRWWRTQRP